MIIASVGIAIEFFAVLVVPFVADIPKGQQLSKLASTNECDVHPQLHNLSSVEPDFPFFCRWASKLAMLAMYGGISAVVALAVIGGLTAHEMGYMAVSLICSLIIGAAYLLVHLSVWLTSKADFARHAMRAYVTMLPKFSTLHHAAVAAAMTMRRASMIAIIFLMDRLRVMKVVGWDGSRLPWVCGVFIVTTVAFLLEVAVSALIGAHGVHETGYYGSHIYSGCPRFQVARYICNGVSNVGVLICVYVISIHKDPTQQEAALPTAVLCVFILAGLFFVMHGVHSLAFFLKDVVGWDHRKFQETTIAACVSVRFCPMACILFIAARLRALQITDRGGSPQTWAQTAMYVIAFAVVIQAFCCLALPLFTGMSTECDADGNAVYDFKPLFGAYLVTGVKYFALLGILTGIVAVCISIYCITPQTATYGVYGGYFDALQYLLFAALAVLLALCLSSAKVVGLAIKIAVEQAAKSHLGIDINAEHVALSIFDGWVHCRAIVVSNLQKGAYTFQSPYAIKFQKMVIALDLWALLKSKGKEVIIRKIEIIGVDMIMEKQSFTEWSNLQTLAKHLDRTKLHVSDRECPVPFCCLDPVCGKCAKSVRLEYAKMQETRQKLQKLKDPSFVSLHDVSITQVRASLFQNGQTVLEVDLSDVDVKAQGRELAPFEVLEMLVYEVLGKASSSAEFRKRLLQLMGQRLTDNIMGCVCQCRKEDSSSSQNESDRTVFVAEDIKKKRRKENE
jgi:hypothetical protein